MCRCLALLIALGCGVLGGCFWAHKERTTTGAYPSPMAGVIGDDVVYLDVAVIERTLGDPFLNRDLWSEADEEVVHIDGEPAVNLERKTALEKNGFRIGQVGGLLPSKLQDLLMSQRDCQTRRIQLHAGHETILPCGPSWPHCHYRLHRDDQPATIELDDAQCVLEVVPSLADEGRVRLHFLPCVRHGSVKPDIVPVLDADGQRRWDQKYHQAEEVYPCLDWTLTLVPNEYAVLGTLLVKGETLGEQFFLTWQKDHPIVQRLLVLRATHVPTPAQDDLGRCPPLSLRAGMITARGSGK